MSESVLAVEPEVSYLTMVSLRRLLSIGDLKRYRDSAESRHRLVMSIFPKLIEQDPRSSGGVLFRGEKSLSESTVLIRSTIAPANVPGVHTVKEDFSIFESGRDVRFRITVSPIVRSQSSGKTKERFISDFDEIEEWISNKLSPGLSKIQIISSKNEEVRRGKSKNFVKLEQIDGIAKVGDVSNLLQMLSIGIGRNKSYGAGLLTVALI